MKKVLSAEQFGFLSSRQIIYIGLHVEVTNWMMVCIYSPSFSILVNYSPTIFFPSNRELIKGYPLSPLLFILVIEGLSRIILHVKVEHKIKGINITHSLPITHLLFVDDVLIFGLGNR